MRWGTKLERFLHKNQHTQRKLLNFENCLVLLHVPKCFGLVQIFCARPKIYLHIVAVTNILCQTKRWFACSKIGFWAVTKVFEEALNAVEFLGWLKKFGAAQNILGPVKGQGIYWNWRESCCSHTKYFIKNKLKVGF